MMDWWKTSGTALWSATIGWLESLAREASQFAVEYAWVFLYLFLTVATLVTLRALFFRKAPVGVELTRAIRRPRFFGYVTVCALIISLASWSLFAPIASASIAFGVVSPDGSRKTISHLEGGIIQSIHVREGETVAAGDPLVTLEDVRARTEYSALRERMMFLLASRARLEAQRTNKERISFPDELKRFGGETVETIIEAQNELLESQELAHKGREKIYRQRISQINEHTAGLEEVIAAQDEQLAILEVEIENYQTLLEKGLTQASILFSLQKERTELIAKRAINSAKIAENREAIATAEIELLNLREGRIEDAHNKIPEIDNEISELRSQLESRSDVLKRTIIRAPNAGTVIDLQVATVGGVVRPGASIMELVPLDAQLIVDARVKPIDIDRVRPGMEARIILSAYKQRNLPLISGTLLSISADRLEEDRTGEPYYLAKVEVNPADLKKATDVKLIPGMPTEVMILDGERSVIHYLLDPLTASFERSFREQ
ncbi:HlyD family type I secretion periplasmic adaptor subunit [Boseongicola aestuarii]|uniref:Membrane fusion protein (MFP) family protein n=1 Tax=Boseongicola aestuarii TaxID=1470561 RepID=A0A238J380_9RHOB|nr:HlyD family type I secretion periplasmic adaptor subunit [Boseongicola aestuarii]SMX24692.1 Type I secretion system membrane fusion protein PrsE [Boseongicola aestuarii]